MNKYVQLKTHLDNIHNNLTATIQKSRVKRVGKMSTNLDESWRSEIVNSRFKEDLSHHWGRHQARGSTRGYIKFGG